MRRLARCIVCIAALSKTATSIAGAGAYLVDDASITPAGECQIQSWLQSLSGGQQSLNMLPACSTGPVEWSLGITGQNHPYEHQESPAVKWMIVDGEHRPLGLAVNVGATWANGHVVSKNTYGALTWTPGSERLWSLNIDLGEIYDRSQGWRPLVGVGMKYRASEHLAIILEHIHPWNGLAMNQAGIRWRFNDHDSLDVIVGRSNAQVHDRWLTLGINLAL